MPALRAPNEFEDATRKVRWLVIGIVALTFPFDPPRIYMVWGLVVAAVLYNSMRYLPWVQRNRILTSPAVIIAIDELFIGTFIGIVNNPFSPYSMLLIFMIITAAYQYRMLGVFLLVPLEVVPWYILSRQHWATPLQLDDVRRVIIVAMIFQAVGWLVERLTRIERRERDRLRQLIVENETERSRLLTLIGSLKTAVFVVNSKGKILLHNPAAAELSGNSDLHGRSLKSILPLHIRTDLAAKPIDLLEDGTANLQQRRDLSLTNSQGQTVDLEVTLQPVRLQDATTTDCFVICEDITRERSLDEQRSEFISVSSHELRTPIAIMEAALSTLMHLQEPLSDEAGILVKQAHDNSLLLSEIVKDLSMLAQAKNDNLPVQLEQLDPIELANSIADSFRPQVTDKGLRLRLVLGPTLPSVLSAKNHIREILQNYLTNAIKYSNTGTITLKVAPTKSGGVVFSVKDQGLGITAENQKYLFNKFFRAEDYRIRQTGGTGLGLYLCRELAERLGGKVWCKSALNKGSTFYLELPPYSTLPRDRRAVREAKVANLVEEI